MKHGVITLLIVILINWSFCCGLSYFLFFHHSIIHVVLLFFLRTRGSLPLWQSVLVYTVCGVFIFVALMRSGPLYFPY